MAGATRSERAETEEGVAPEAGSGLRVDAPSAMPTAGASPREGSPPRVGPDAVVRRIEEALRSVPGGARPIVATDADGTLWSGDVGIDLFEAALAARALRDEARDALAAEARAHGIEARGGACEIAAALYEAFGAGRYPEDRAFAAMAWAFAGFREAELGAFVEGVLDRGGIDARFRSSLRAVLAWARSASVDVVVVSASPRAIVEAGARRAGIDPRSVVAMTPLVQGGVVRAALAAPPVYGEGKVKALERVAPGATLVAAFGDSAYDAAMLRAARVPVAVCPSPRLLALAATIPGLVVVEE